jgi:hypothetical protein
LIALVGLIDCDAAPSVRTGWKIEEHRKLGQWTWNPGAVHLYLSPSQQAGKCIEGHLLRSELSSHFVLNAKVLEYLLANSHLIPDEWKMDKRKHVRCIFFWGTIYRDLKGDLYVWCLSWSGHNWGWDCGWLGDSWSDTDYAAVALNRNFD